MSETATAVERPIRWTHLKRDLINEPAIDGIQSRLETVRMGLQAVGKIIGEKKKPDGAWHFSDAEADAIRRAVGARGPGNEPGDEGGGDPSDGNGAGEAGAPGGGESDVEDDASDAANPAEEADDTDLERLADRPGSTPRKPGKIADRKSRDDDDEADGEGERKRLSFPLLLILVGGAVVAGTFIWSRIKKKRGEPSTPDKPAGPPERTGGRPLDPSRILEQGDGGLE